MPVQRPIIASLIAPICSLAPLLLLGVWEASQPASVMSGEPDDAPMRAFGVLLVSLPIVYVVMALFAHFVGLTLRRLGLRSLKAFLAASSAIAVALAITVGLALSQPQRFGAQDALVSVAAFAGLFLLCVVPGAACWWYLTRATPNPSIERTCPGKPGHAAHVER